MEQYSSEVEPNSELDTSTESAAINNKDHHQDTCVIEVRSAPQSIKSARSSSGRSTTIDKKKLRKGIGSCGALTKKPVPAPRSPKYIQHDNGRKNEVNGYRQDIVL